MQLHLASYSKSLSRVIEMQVQDGIEHCSWIDLYAFLLNLFVCLVTLSSSLKMHEAESRLGL